jgi:hypothetical protein
MKLTKEEKIELFRLIANKVHNRRYKIDDSLIKSISRKLAKNIILGEDKEPRKERGN